MTEATIFMLILFFHIPQCNTPRTRKPNDPRLANLPPQKQS